MLMVFCGVRTNQMVCGLMITAPTESGGEVARMAKPSAFLQRLEAQRRHDMELQRLFTIQQCEDMMLITLGQDFGFGPKRAMEALDAIEPGMCRVKESRDIWQNGLVYALCQGVRLLLTEEIKGERGRE